LKNIDFDPIYPLTGPVYVENAEVGDVLTVDLLKIELHDYGWQAIVGGFRLLTDRFPNPKLSIYKIDKLNRTINYNDKVKIPLKPFAGMMGVAQNTDELLSTIPPRKKWWENFAVKIFKAILLSISLLAKKVIRMVTILMDYDFANRSKGSIPTLVVFKVIP